MAPDGPRWPAAVRATQFFTECIMSEIHMLINVVDHNIPIKGSASFSACDRLGWDLDSKSKPQLCVDVGEVCGTLSSSPFMASGNSTI